MVSRVKLNYPWSKHSPPPVGFPFSKVRGLGHENDWGSLPIGDKEYDDALTTLYVEEFLNQLDGDEKFHSFWLACGLFRPHLPWYVPRKYFEQYPLNEIVLPADLDSDLEDLPVGKE